MSLLSSALWTRTRKNLERPALPHEGMNTIPLGVRIAALVLRAVFMGILVVLVVRVSSPLNETIWSAYDTPGDLGLFWDRLRVFGCCTAFSRCPRTPRHIGLGFTSAFSLPPRVSMCYRLLVTVSSSAAKSERDEFNKPRVLFIGRSGRNDANYVFFH